ncbi:DUF421 domain-containing protein [Oceanobacillus senegalensis]|uniref:DUF421 domain-containing protein n=1 Tax=Oceanobacillus senegalensis TaxID=1936063 RepID=UPI000A3060EB|nr:DUF421 domain-containing protein [Oceanobacillus senegalensis]
MVDITIELLVGFLLLFIIVRLVGKKIINQISPFTFIAAIVLSEIVGNAIYEPKINVFYIFYAMVLWGGLLFLLEYSSQKFIRFRGITEGKPSALIENGKVNREQLKKNRMTINQLQSLLRQSETFSIREVAFCYLESNGAISILKKSAYQKTTQEDFNLPVQSVHVPVTIIRDGEVLWDEVRDLGYDEKWLKNLFVSNGIQNMDYSQIFLAEWHQVQGLFYQTYQE